jgi:hypothetical protein
MLAEPSWNLPRASLLESGKCGKQFLATDPEVRVRFPALPHFLRSSGSGTGFTQLNEYSRGVNGVICVAEK